MTEPGAGGEAREPEAVQAAPEATIANEGAASSGEASSPGEAATASEAATAGEAAPSAGEDPEVYPTLQEEFADLAPVLRASMLGKPAQAITGLLIGVLILVALLFGVTMLAKNGAGAPASPEAPASPSALVIDGWAA